MPHIGWLNSSVAGLGGHGSNGIFLICSRATCTSSLVSIHFFLVNFRNFIHAPTYPLPHDGNHTIITFTIILEQFID